MSAAQPDIRGNVFPIYLAADQSQSMTPWIQNLNKGLEYLLNEMHKYPLEAAKIRFAIIGFADDAHVELAMCDLRDIREVPKLSPRGKSTRYSAAFDMLRERIPQDIELMSSQGYGVLRPTVFFLTDGEPMEIPADVWMSSLSRLTDNDWRPHPNILSFGIDKGAREENAGNIRKVATRPDYAFVAADPSKTGEALTEFLKALMHTVVESARNLNEGGTDLLVEPPAGFVKVSADLIT
ncbi:hypothetical protein ACFWWT_26515 [Streptomyces sp. NPDC058676]|uniref:vWA domain-containing protein n=1 Tax=unclassified Streptomyces TaxID=2593676 RepID=UPI00364910DA